jgi:hypothetical protein
MLELIETIKYVEKIEELKQIGEQFSPEAFLYLLEQIHQQTGLQKKLSSILISLPINSFIKSLEQMKNSHESVLKCECMTEPLLHLFSLFIHDCEQLIQTTNTYLANELKTIYALNLNHLNLEEINQIEMEIEYLKSIYIQRLKGISHAQTILWNSERIDLIDKLSSIKERMFHQLYSQEIDSLTKIKFILEDQLSKFFIFLDPDLGKEYCLQNDDSALEAFTKFEIWYLVDYWKLGLLPHIIDPQELELEVTPYSPQKDLTFRQMAFKTLEENLRKLKIEKVQDLKKERIFSKSLLESYIQKHIYLLNRPVNEK